MAKSQSFFSLRRGSTKSMTFQVLAGQQITKDRVTEVSNPRTNGQMLQRARFATAVKFYKRAVSNFFKFAFEDKKQQESDYNAFMRYNAKLGSIVSKTDSDDIFFPAVGPFIMSNGSLPTIAVKYRAGSSTPTEDFYLPFDVSSAETIGNLSTQILASNSAYLAGDIITIVIVSTGINDRFENEQPDVYPVWSICQFRLDPTNTAALETLNNKDIKLIADGTELQINKADVLDGYVAGACCIVSRNVPGGLLVSFSQMLPNLTALNYINHLADPTVLEANLVSWGTTGEAILQGSIADRQAAPAVVPTFTTFHGAQTTVAAAADSSITLVGYALADELTAGSKNYVLLGGRNLDKIDVSKFDAENAQISNFEVGYDNIYGYWLSFSVTTEVGDNASVIYDGDTLFTVTL